MIDHILSRLELADRFEANARRHQRSRNKAPNWQNICATCLADARRERARAEKLAMDHGLSFDMLTAENAAERRAEHAWSGDLGKITIAEILRCAAVAGGSTIGSRRMARAVERVIRAADILASAIAIQQLHRWVGKDSSPGFRILKATARIIPIEGIEEADGCEP